MFSNLLIINHKYFKYWFLGQFYEPITPQEFIAVVDLFVNCLSKRGCKVSHKSNERFIKALFWMPDNCAKWRSLPVEFGKWNSVYFRFDSLRKQGVFEEFMQKLSQTSETSHILVSIDG